MINKFNHSVESFRGTGRRLLVLVMTLTTAAMTVASGGVMTAFAAQTSSDTKTQTFTVTLAESENGSLAFTGKDGSAVDGSSLSVEPGDSVTVKANPGEGYYATSVSAVGASGEVQNLKVDEDASVTFTPSENVTLTGYFSDKSNNRYAEALHPLDVESGKHMSYEDYVRKNMNPKYVGNGDSLTAKDYIRTNVSVVDGVRLPDATLDKLWDRTDSNGDGISDNADKLVMQADSFVALYEVSKDADYYVGRVGGDLKGAHIVEWVTAFNSGEADLVDDIVFDKATQLVYVPKHYAADGLSTYIQLLYQTDGDPLDVKANIGVDIDAKGISGKIVNSGEAGSSLFAPDTYIKLALDDKSIDAIDTDSIDSVEVAGIRYDAKSGIWSYDKETGILSVKYAPVNNYEVKVHMSDTFTKKLSRFWNNVTGMFIIDGKAAFGPKEPMETHDWVIKFQTTPHVGQEIIVTSRNYYANKRNGNGWATPGLNSHDALMGYFYDDVPISLQTTGKADVDVSKEMMIQWRQSLERAAHIYEQTVDGIEIPDMKVDLFCSHASVSVGDDLAMSGNGGGYEGYEGKSLIRVFAVDGDTILVGITNPTRGSQAGAGFFRLHWELSGGYVSVKKESANPEYTNGNSAYSMVGAVYGLYTDEACKNLLAKMTIASDETGLSNEVGPFPAGTYYAKEISAAKGYNVSPTVKTVTITAGEHSVAKFTKDEPTGSDPMQIIVQKAVNGESEAGKPRGDVSLEGVRFKVEYYKNFYNTVAEAKQSGAPTASAVFATDAKGRLRFASATPVEGTWPYKLGNFNTMPLGTVVVTEVSGGEGLVTDSRYPQAFQIKDSGERLANGNIRTEIKKIGDNWPGQTSEGVGAYVNKSYVSGVVVEKQEKHWADANDGKHPASSDEGDGSLAGVRYVVINRSAERVKYKGNYFAPGEVVTTITTAWDDNAKAYIAKTDNVYWDANSNGFKVDTSDGARDRGLDFGTYEIKELSSSDDGSANDSHINGGFDEIVKYRKEAGDGYLFDYTRKGKPSINPIWLGGIRVGKVDRETGQYIQLGEAELNGSTFDIINRSAKDIYVYGNVIKPGEVVMTIATEWKELNGKKVCVAETPKVLPYGTYEVRETGSGTGYLYDKTSESWTVTVQQHTHDGYTEVLDESDVVGNQVKREDWSFKKKDEDSMERMGKVAFLVTSRTTGESHVIVTDENGTWGSSWVAHSEKTNANDPDSPISNGAIKRDKDGNYVVVDQSKLDSEAGTWFTGMSSDMTTWGPDGKSYVVNGKKVSVKDNLRAFPYDTYTVTELPSEANEGHVMVQFTVTLHKYGDNNGKGIDIDYGTIDDKLLTISTMLSGDTGKSIPSNSTAATLTDKVYYEGLSPKSKYILEGELHAVDDEGKDIGVVATARKEFSAASRIGSVDVLFENVDMTKVGSNTLVAFEYLKDANGGDLAKHEDLTDENQTVTIPTIGTTLKGVDEHEGNASAKTIELVDTVDYKGLEVGKNYTMTGKLMDKATGEALVDADGKAITASTTFAPTKSSGSVNVVFTFSGVDVAGKTVVAFESLMSGDVEFASHADIEDAGQTVTFPSVATTLTDKADGDKFVNADKEQTVVDTVDAKNLVAGKEYTISGELHIQKVAEDGTITDGGVLKDADGKAVTATKTFTADAANMKVDLEFKFDTTSLGNTTVVAFEELKRGDVQLGLHADITDVNQSVYVPKIGTTFVTKDGRHVIQASSEKKVADAKDESAKDETPKAEATEPVTEDKADATAKSEAEAKPESEAKSDDKADDKPVEDKKQSDEVELVDTIAYKNLAPGKKYVATGVLHLKNVDEKGNVTDGGIAKDANGNDITATAEFTPEASEGTVDVTFKFNAAGLGGKQTVAFETVSDGGKTVAVHADITDKNQTVDFVDIGTKAADASTKNHVMSETTSVTIVDTVSYTGLTPGNSYVVNGNLHIQKVDGNGNITDGGVLKDVNGKEVVASASLVPEKADGTVDVTFKFEIKAGALDGSTVVAFEDLMEGDVVIATHADIKDKEQSVHKLKVGTTLTGADGKSKDIQVGDKIDVIDTIAFENLVVGETYTARGKLVDAEGKAIKTKDGKEVTAETEFTPKEANGEVQLKFTLDTSGAADGDKVVAYEYVYSGDTLVGKHEDPKDTNQTVTVKKASDTPKEHVDLKTGIGNAGTLIAAVMAVVLAGLTAYYVRKRREEV